MTTQSGSFAGLGFGIEKNSVTGALQLGGQGLAGANEILISERILTASTPSVTFSDIPDDYDLLRLEIVARSDIVSTTQSLKIEFNGDTTVTNYHRQDYVFDNGSNLSSEGQDNYVGDVAGASATADYYGIVTIIIPNYTGAWIKSADGVSNQPSNTGLARIARRAVHRHTGSGLTSAITSLAITADGNNFISGSKFKLIGVKSGIPAQVGGITKIQKQTLTGSQASITFENIPQKYDALYFLTKLRTDEAATAVSQVLMTVNGDTTSTNYRTQNVAGAGGAGSFGETNDPRSCEAAGSTAPAESFSTGQITINGYASATGTKKALCVSQEDRGGAGALVANNRAWFKVASSPAAAITSVTFTPLTGAVNFITDSEIILFGIGGTDQQLAVEALTASRSLNNNTDVGKVFTNEGATSSVAFTLPDAIAGLNYTFVVEDTDGLSITAQAGDTIRIYDQLSASGGNATSTDQGATIILTAISSSKWVATSGLGTWTVT